MKKTLALILSIVLVLGVAAPALAADWTDGPTFALTADAAPDENGGIKVTLELQGKDDDLLGAVTLNLVYDDEKVEPDTSKGSFKKSGKTFGIDLPECINSFSSKLVTPANTKTVSGNSCKVFTVACTTDEDPSEGVGASSKINYYFKVKEGAEGPAVFTLATDTNVNFKVTDITGDNNAIRPAEGSLTATCNIPKSPITVSIEAIADQTYTGSAIEPALTVKAGEKTLTLTDDYTVTYTNNVNAGTATATIAPAGGNQFKPDSVLSKTFTINPASLAVVWGESTLTYTGEAQAPTATTSFNGTDVPLTVSGKQTDVGAEYVATAALATANSNYTLTGNSYVYSITKADYAGDPLTGSAVVPVAGVTDKAVAVSLPAGFKDVAQAGDAVVDGTLVTAASYANGSIVLTTAEAAENATGSVTVTLSSKNYNNVTYTLNVTAKKVEAEWTTEPTGKDVVYGAKNSAAVANLGAATVKDPEGNPVSFQIKVADADAVQNAGDERSVTVNVVTEEYGVVLSKTLTVKIAPAPAKVTWKNTKFEYTGAAFAPTATVTGGVNGETLSVEVVGEATGTGPHTATASLIVTGGNALAANYELDKPTCEFEITGKKITFQVTLTPDTFTENGSVQQPVVTVNAKEDVVLTADDYVVEIPESIDAGTYTVTVSAKEGSPYFGSKAVTAQYKICGKPSYKTLTVSDGHTALTARYAFDDNGYAITKYEVTVLEVLFDTEGNETGTQALEGSPFDAGTKTSYTVSRLTTGSTYRVSVKATNEAGSVDSETKEVTLTKFVAPLNPTYSVNIQTPENGNVTASAFSAEEGEEIKLTVTADKGYELARLTVVDADGNELAINGSEGEYSFTMAGSDVTVTAVFQAITIPAFEDVKEGAYYYNAVQWAAENQIAKGRSETLFVPLDNATRAEVVTFLWRQAGMPEPAAAENAFEDVAEDAYYFKAVLWAVEAGVVKGKSETAFDPNATITRAELVTMLYRLAKASAPEGELAFTDVPADAYYAEAVLWAARNGITEGTSETTFEPNVACNRAQVITMLYRFFK